MAEAEDAQEFAGRSAEGRYANDLIAFCQRNHLAGDVLQLSELAVEPRFIPPTPFAEPPSEDTTSYDVFRVVPKIPDLPFLHSPYNVDTVSLEDLSFGDRAVALLGEPGSGRSTTLQIIALWAMGVVDFKPPIDAVEQLMLEEEKEMSHDQKAKREQERRAIEERALNRLAEQQGKEEEDLAPVTQRVLSPFRRMIPIMTHMANIQPFSKEFGNNVDPAEPLVRALQYEVTGITAKTIPMKIYQGLKKKQMLVLIDGFDELSQEEQQKRLPWLRSFIQLYKGNFIIVTGGARGYGVLQQAGLLPVLLRPLNDTKTEEITHKWVNNWAEYKGSRRKQDALRPSDELIEAVQEQSRGYSMMDYNLKVRAAFNDDIDLEAGSGIGHWMASYLDKFDIDDELKPRIAELAALQFDEGFITVERLQDIALGIAEQTKEIGATTPDEPVADDGFAAAEDLYSDAFEDEVLAEVESAVEEAVQTKPKTKKEIEAEEKAAQEKREKLEESTGLDRKEIRAIKDQEAALVKKLEELGLLVKYRGNKYLFKHTLIAAYFAAQTLKGDPAKAAARSLQPAWNFALNYAMDFVDLSLAVETQLDLPPDVLYSNIMKPARWLAYRSKESEIGWRASYMQTLGRMFLVPNQYPHLRERAASALVGTLDESALVIFQRGLQSPEQDVRRLSALGIGAFGTESAVSHLAPFLEDEIPEVSLAVGMALGAIGSEEAFDHMITAFSSGDERLRQAVAETLASLPEDGYPLLYEAINHSDMMLRRAAVFGLRRIRAPWAMIAIYRAFLEDSQWYVRSAAQQAFNEIQNFELSSLLRPYPDLERVEWLTEWLMEQGEDGAELNAEDALLEILQGHDPVLRTVAVKAVGQLGMAHRMIYVYDSLLFEDFDVRDAAHRALSGLQVQIGSTLPAPA